MVIIMFVYANLLGKWTELTESDNIEGGLPQTYAEQVLLNPEYQGVEKDFIEVTVKNTTYYLHKSCIQCTITH